MDENLIYIIAGAAALLVIIIIVFLIYRKKKGKPGKDQAPLQQMVGSKYNGREASDEELDSVARIELINFVDGVNTLALRFEIKGGTIKLDDVEPYDNDWGFVHNYNEIIGQKRQSGQQLRLFFNRRKRKNVDAIEAFTVNIVYRDTNGIQWLQPLKYNSKKGLRAKEVLILGADAKE